MPAVLSEHSFITALRQVVGARYNGKPFFLWQGDATGLRAIIESLRDLKPLTEWVDVNRLAQDVIPRRAREVLRSRVESVLRRSIEAEFRILVVENPWLLLRYEPAAPLAMLWNSFTASDRAVVVVLPRSVPRPPSLPQFVRFRGEAPGELFAAADGSFLVEPSGGVESW